MNDALTGRPAEPPRPPASRRSLLRAGTLLSLSAVAGAGCAARARQDGDASTSARVPGQRLVLDYRPSQVTGWAPDYGLSPTLGWHVSSRDFTLQGARYRVSLLPLGQPGDSPDPVYENVPADPMIKFRQTLASAWGAYYSFRYPGGLRGPATFAVQSYSVWSGKPPGGASGMGYGADIYVVYRPGGHEGHPAITGDLQVIQVIYTRDGANSSRMVDNAGRANPFFGEGGGLTWINQNQSFSYYDRSGRGDTSPIVFMAETFLAQDTRTTDAAGKQIVNIFGGIKSGWKMDHATT